MASSQGSTGVSLDWLWADFIRRQLETLLSVVSLERDGTAVDIDGFRIRNPERRLPALPSVRAEGPPGDGGQEEARRPGSSYQDIKNAAIYEPRIELIKKQLEGLLAVVDLESKGEVIDVDGFRLRNLKHWLSPSPCDPSEIFGYAATRCNCDCVFCCNKGNPPSLALGNLERPAAEEFHEMKTRLDYFLPEAGYSLFPTLGSIYEAAIHPRFLEILRLIRQRTSQVLRVTTNGDSLTPRMVAELVDVKPVYLYLSLNSASLARRGRLMRGKNPRTGIDSLPLLREGGIPYATVIVPWPVDAVDDMLDDLATTVAYADANDTHLVQVNLPGYTRCFSEERLYDLGELWSKVVSRVRNLRDAMRSPIVVMPGMYEENLHEERMSVARVIGLVRNSPAERGGLKRGDVIVKVGSIGVSSRPQARDLLSVLQRSEMDRTSLTVMRDGHDEKVDIKLDDFSYPYARQSDRHLGVVFMGTGLRPSYLETLRGLIKSYDAREVLFLSSALVEPTFRQMVAESHLFGGVRLNVIVPENRFFGGNIFMGDLLVVQDFIDCIKDYLGRTKKAPDLIVIPSSPFSLGGWGRDLTGRVYLDIEREVGIPVALLECHPIFD